MFYLDFDGPLAKRIDRQTYTYLKMAASIPEIARQGFPFPVETDSGNNYTDNTRIMVQLLRITDDYLKALEEHGFDISRILSPERLEFYRINKNK